MSSRIIGALCILLGLAGGARAAVPQLDELTRTWKFPRTLSGAEAPVMASPWGSGGTLPGPLATSTWIFTADQRVDLATSNQQLWPDIDVSLSGVVGVVWMGDATGGYHIYYSQSTDLGATWSTPEKVDSRATGAYSKFPDLEFTPSGMPVVVWEDDRNVALNVFISKRDPAGGGTPWTTNVQVNTAGSPPGGSYYMNASVAVLDNARYFVVWTDWREGVFNQVYSRTTRNGGATWTAEARVSDEIGYQPLAGDPCIIVDPSTSGPGTETLYCVMDDWRGFASGGRFPNAYISRSANGGASWSNGVRVNDIEPYFQQVSSQALVKLEDGTLTCGWLNDQFGPRDFRTSVSIDGGATWSAGVVVNQPAPGGLGTWSSITASGSWVFAGYDFWGSDWDAYFRASADGGRTWTEPPYRMDTDGAGGAPVANTVVAAFSPTRVYAAWEDGRPYPGPWCIRATRGSRVATSVDPAGVGSSERAGELAIWPNPFHAGEDLHIVFAERAAAGFKGSLAIYDISGREVRHLAMDEHGARWDGRDAEGRTVAPGVYRARSSSAGLTSEPILVVR